MTEYDSEHGERLETEKKSLREIAEEKLDREMDETMRACGIIEE